MIDSVTTCLTEDWRVTLFMAMVMGQAVSAAFLTHRITRLLSKFERREIQMEIAWQLHMMQKEAVAPSPGKSNERAQEGPGV